MSAIITFEVVADAGDLHCVTEHPGFDAVCLNNWSLKLSAEKYKTKAGTRYRRTGFENRSVVLRSCYI